VLDCGIIYILLIIEHKEDVSLEDVTNVMSALLSIISTMKINRKLITGCITFQEILPNSKVSVIYLKIIVWAPFSLAPLSVVKSNSSHLNKTHC
jgi:hypothetical protein